VHVLNRIATADCAVPDWKIIYTQFLNEGGGIEADLTITRLAHDQFLVVTAAFTRTHVEAWIREHVEGHHFCTVADVSEADCMLSVQGSKSRELLQQLINTDMSHEAFPFGTARQIELGYQTVLALRITYVGELGWELYIPTSDAAAVYDSIIDIGKRHGLRLCGHHKLNSLRIEKAYREWSHDIGSDDTPIATRKAPTASAR